MAKHSSADVARVVIGYALGPAVAILTAPILAQGLGVAGRGEATATTAPFILAMSLATLGLPEGAQYFGARGRLGGRNGWLAAGLLLLVGCAVVGGLGLAAPFLSAGDPLVRDLIRTTAWILVPVLLGLLLRGIAAGQGRWGLITIERGITALSRLAAIVALWATDNLTVTTATYAIIASFAVGALAYLGLLFRRDRRSYEPPPAARQVVAYGARIWIGALSGVLLQRVDQAVMLPLSSAEQLGLYAVAVSLAEIPLAFNAAIRDVMVSRVASLLDRAAVARASRASTIIVVTMAIGVGLASWALMGPVFGEGFVAALPALYILLLATVLGNPGSVAGAALSGMGKPGRRSLAIIVALVTNVVLLILLVPHMGAVGAAVSTLVANVVSGNLSVFWASRALGGHVRDFYRFSADDVRYLVGVGRQIARRRRG